MIDESVVSPGNTEDFTKDQFVPSSDRSRRIDVAVPMPEGAITLNVSVATDTTVGAGRAVGALAFPIARLIAPQTLNCPRHREEPPASFTPVSLRRR